MFLLSTTPRLLEFLQCNERRDMTRRMSMGRSSRCWSRVMSKNSIICVLLGLLALTFYINTHPEQQYQHSADTPIRAQSRPPPEPPNLDARRQGGHLSVEAARQAVATAQHQLHQAQADLARATADSPRSEEGAVATLVQPLHTSGAAGLTPELTDKHPTMRLSPDPPIPTEVSTAAPTNPPATDAPSGPPTAPATDEPTTSRTLELKSCGVVCNHFNGKSVASSSAM